MMQKLLQVQFRLSFVHVTPHYTQDKTYTKGKLRALTPKNVLHWMNLKAFGVEDPPVDGSLLWSGKFVACLEAISLFMPNRLMVWVSGRNEGNPTRSIEVNNLIKRVKKTEVRKQGAASQCRRAITEVEFQTMQRFYRITTDVDLIPWRFGLYALN
jgi:hypothetical protein